MTSYQPGEPPPYTPPQDPWAGAPGIASPPTDPIPQAPRGQFAPGVAAPVPAPPSVWSQETIASGPPRGSGRTGLYVLVTIFVLVLGSAGGFGAWYLITERVCPGSSICGDAGPSATTGSTTSPYVFRPADVRVGDCLVNHGTDEVPEMHIEACDTAGALRVLKIEHGEQIQENAEHKLDGNVTPIPICTGVPGWDHSWFGWDSPIDAEDYVFCLQNA